MSVTRNVMKASVLALSLVSALASAAGDDGIVSDDGGVTLLGHVYTGTCKVTTDGQDSTDTVRPEVTLPSLHVADLKDAAIGDLLGDNYSKFNVEVSGCAGGVVPDTIAFNQGVFGVDSNGVNSYKNDFIGQGSTPVATGVGAAIVLASAPTAAVTFGQPLTLTETSTGVSNVEVGAQFIKTAATVGSGAFSTVATFDIIYK